MFTLETISCLQHYVYKINNMLFLYNRNWNIPDDEAQQKAKEWTQGLYLKPRVKMWWMRWESRSRCLDIIPRGWQAREQVHADVSKLLAEWQRPPKHWSPPWESSDWGLFFYNFIINRIAVPEKTTAFWEVSELKADQLWLPFLYYLTYGKISQRYIWHR